MRVVLAVATIALANGLTCNVGTYYIYNDVVECGFGPSGSESDIVSTECASGKDVCVTYSDTWTGPYDCVYEMVEAFCAVEDNVPDCETYEETWEGWVDDVEGTYSDVGCVICSTNECNPSVAIESDDEELLSSAPSILASISTLLVLIASSISMVR